MVEFLREPMGVVGRELRVGLVLNSSELRLSEPSLKPLLMELLSSQLQETMTEKMGQIIFKYQSSDFWLILQILLRYLKTCGQEPRFSNENPAVEVLYYSNRLNTDMWLKFILFLVHKFGRLFGCPWTGRNRRTHAPKFKPKCNQASIPSNGALDEDTKTFNLTPRTYRS